MAIKRQICLVPRIAKPGDLVFILHGAKVPFVLRMRQDGFNEESEKSSGDLILMDGLEYEVVGPCLTPEEMWGHAVKAFDENSDLHLVRLVLV